MLLSIFVIMSRREQVGAGASICVAVIFRSDVTCPISDDCGMGELKRGMGGVFPRIMSEGGG